MAGDRVDRILSLHRWGTVEIDGFSPHRACLCRFRASALRRICSNLEGAKARNRPGRARWGILQRLPGGGGRASLNRKRSANESLTMQLSVVERSCWLNCSAAQRLSGSESHLMCFAWKVCRTKVSSAFPNGHPYLTGQAGKSDVQTWKLFLHAF